MGLHYLPVFSAKTSSTQIMVNKNHRRQFCPFQHNGIFLQKGIFFLFFKDSF